MMRGGARQHERDTARRTAIPITVRQLEAIIRIAEALAKVSLSPFALASHVDEALRLFRVSTLDAAMSGSLSGEFTPFCRSTSHTHLLPSSHIVSCMQVLKDSPQRGTRRKYARLKDS